MKKRLILICGVPASGKTWVCKHVVTDEPGKFKWVSHDEHIDKDFVKALKEAYDGRTLITECPFGERQVLSDLKEAGFDVIPIFIVEKPLVVAVRYYGREGKGASQATLTRAASIKNRAEEWNAPYGSSREVLDYILKSL